MTSDRLTIRTADLREPFERECKKRRMTKSQLARLALCELLKIDVPELRRGRPKKKESK